MAEEIPDRVRTVVRRSGLTQGEFAGLLGLDPTKLSKSLGGVRRFTSLELAQIAERGGVTVDWLLRGTGDASPALAARADVLSPDAVGSAVDRAGHLDDLWSTLVEIGALHRPPERPVVPLRGRMVDQGATLADAAWAEVREHGLADRITADLADVVETVFGVHVAIEQLGAGLDGLSYRRADFRLALVAADSAWTRQRFTIAHELGHLLAGDADGVLVDADVMEPSAARDRREMRANAFAAAFLMPADVVLEQCAAGVELHDFARLVGALRVSPSALAWRLKSLGVVDGEERARLAAMSPRAAALLGGWSDDFRTLDTERGATRPCMGLVRAALLAYERGDVSIRPLAAVLGKPPEEVLTALQPQVEGTSGSADTGEPIFTP